MALKVLPADQDGALSAAAKVLSSGNLAIVPTETVYGLTADATNSDAVSKIYEAKGRPSNNPLIAHVSGLDMASAYSDFTGSTALKLAEAFWPGPLTLVLPIKPDSGLAPEVTAGLKTIALRWPNGPMAALAKMLDRPLAAPSANLSGKISGSRLEDIVDDFHNSVAVALNDGPTQVGIESTIAKIEPDLITILRPGSVLGEDISNAAIGVKVVEHSGEGDLQAPGMMKSHYAPRASLRLNVNKAEQGESLLAFGPVHNDTVPDGQPVFQLSETKDLAEAAANLYPGLHTLDQPGTNAIAIAPIPNESLGIAINDRLNRAAAPRGK